MKILDSFQRLGQNSERLFARLGSGTLFLFRILAGIPSLCGHSRLLLQQMYSVGVQTFAIISVSGMAVGMVLGLQMYNILVDISAENTLGHVVALSLVRELGPVLTGLLFAGRAGSALTAEIGLMKATDQLAGMEMMAVDPVKRVIVPRFVAGVISMPLLAAIFSAVGILGSYLVGVDLLGVDEGAFWSRMQAQVDLYGDILNGVIKSLVFGILVAWIAVYEGYHAAATTEGVSQATTRTVVHSAFAILGMDFILTGLMFGD